MLNDTSSDLTLIPCYSCSLDAFLASGVGDCGEVAPLHFEQLPFDHPLYIMYSSGTTGAPKCMVHSAGVYRTHSFISPLH